MPEPRHIVVDGSNLATEGRKLPSLAQLDEAVRAYVAEDPEAEVVVVVDASFEHRIDASERDQLEQAELHGEVVSPPAGAIGRGDAFLLRIAQRTGATVLSNDSFQEFHGEHPWLFEDGRLIGGKPVPGVGWIFTPRVPVRGPKSRQATGKAKRDQTRVDGGASLTAPLKAAELAKAAKKAARAAKRTHRLPDGSTPKIGDVWVEPERLAATEDHSDGSAPTPDGEGPVPDRAAAAPVGATASVGTTDAETGAAGGEKRPKAAASAAKTATVKKAAKKATITKTTITKTTPKKTTKESTTATTKKATTKKATTKKAAKKATAKKATAKKATKAKRVSPAAKQAAAKKPPKTTKKTTAAVARAEDEADADGSSGPDETPAPTGRAAATASEPGTGEAEDPGDEDEGRRSRRRASQDLQVRDAIVEATVEALIPPTAAEPKTKGSHKGKRRRRVATPPPAANDPLPFITFVAAYPIGSTMMGEVASFTSHGAMVDVDLPGGGGLHCYVPLAGLGDPPPTKARQVIAKGDRREFVLVSLDPPRRVAELALAPVGVGRSEP